MSNIAIHIDNLGKRYRIGALEAQTMSTGHRVLRLLGSPFAYLRRTIREASEAEVLWALRNFCLDVPHGQVVGIIGRNGAGKSTLLKLLSRVTRPTEGRAKIYGRIASLLEVGTGFHPDLTGRQNVFINGLMMGLTREEIRSRFDEIVAFSDVEKFIDTPVKYYSSGMYVRLAFSVAAHLDPEILLVDEVLAVGDVAFQRKCIAKMEDVSHAGRTILFVSHNISSVLKFCTRTVLLDGGRMVADGPTGVVVNEYVGQGLTRKGERVWENMDLAPALSERFPLVKEKGGDVRLRAVRLLNEQGDPGDSFNIREPITVEVEYWVLEERYSLCTRAYFSDEIGQTIFVSMDNLDSPWHSTSQPAGKYLARCMLPPDLLNEGNIRVEVLIQARDHDFYLTFPEAVSFQAVDDFKAAGVRGNHVGAWPAAKVRPRLSWHVERIGALNQD